MTTRAVEPLSFPDIAPAEVDGAKPDLKWIDPATLRIDDAYQRGLSERSVRLIRRIVSEWSWLAFKPPICVEVDGALHVIDGQHTAIAAVTHGGLGKIPVMAFAGANSEDRSAAFVRHNRDRIAVTPTQLHAALLAAGDEDAQTVDQVCARAGIRILRNPPAFGKFQPGETLSATTIRGLCNRRFAIGARQVLEVCAGAMLAPVSAAHIKAVEMLMFAPEYAGELSAEKIGLLMRLMGDDLITEAKRFSAEHKVPQYRAMASVLFMNRKRRAAP